MRPSAGYRRTLAGDRRRLLESYRFVDLARKVVGVGSVGTRAWVALFVGEDDDDTLILQGKEAEASVLERFVGKSAYDNHGQRELKANGSCRRPATSFWAGTGSLAGLTGAPTITTSASCGTGSSRPPSRPWLPSVLAVYAQLCGWTLARVTPAPATAVAIGAYLGNSDTFPQALAEFADALRRPERSRSSSPGRRHRRRQVAAQDNV